MSFSVGSGPIPHDERAAAPAPVTPRTLRNRLRSIESVIDSSRVLVVTHAAVSRHFVFDVAAHAPPHAQRCHLVHLRHLLHIALARGTPMLSDFLDLAHLR